MQSPVAVIDVGSNTIKLLVAEKGSGSSPKAVHRNTLEARIGKGISADKPVLAREAIARASGAIASLVEEARRFSPEAIRIVATSAARDAENSDELVAAVRNETGLPLDILSGHREAELIGAAVQLDPRIAAGNFYLFDLGGGSLECIRFFNRRLDQMVSLPLGCVRLSERLLTDPADRFTEEDERRIAAEIEEGMGASGFEFSLPPDAIAVGTGGTFTTALAIVAARHEYELEEVSPYLSTSSLRDLLSWIGGLPLSDRLRVDGLSPGRADVFPTALATLLKLADLSAKDGFYHSFASLRNGLAAEILSGGGV